MKKKILIDLSYIGNNDNRGVTKYAFRFLEYISAIGKQNEFILIVNIFAEDEMRSRFHDYEIVVVRKKWMEKLGFFKTFFYAFDLCRIANRLESSVLFCPWANSGNYLQSKQKKVATIHDLQVRIDIEGRKRRDIWRLTHAEDKIVRHSTAIFTISEFAKEQILSFYPNIVDKLYNMSNVVSMKECSDVNPMDIGCKYLLYVGRTDRMKNVMTLVKAFKFLREQDTTLKLVIASNSWDYYDENILQYVQANNLLSSIVQVNNCSDEELARWYKGASVFVFTSLREGFGFPPIEAAYMEIPVVTSKSDSLEEVTLGKLNYYEPATDEKKLALAIDKCIKTPPSKEVLASIKEEFQKRYSIEAFGKRIYTYLESINK